MANSHSIVMKLNTGLSVISNMPNRKTEECLFVVRKGSFREASVFEGVAERHAQYTGTLLFYSIPSFRVIFHYIRNITERRKIEFNHPFNSEFKGLNKFHSYGMYFIDAYR